MTTIWRVARTSAAVRRLRGWDWDGRLGSGRREGRRGCHRVGRQPRQPRLRLIESEAEAGLPCGKADRLTEFVMRNPPPDPPRDRRGAARRDASRGAARLGERGACGARPDQRGARRAERREQGREVINPSPRPAARSLHRAVRNQRASGSIGKVGRARPAGKAAVLGLGGRHQGPHHRRSGAGPPPRRVVAAVVLAPAASEKVAEGVGGKGAS